MDAQHPPWLKLCDFGFAKHWKGSGDSEEGMESVVGTPEYMGPEVANHK